MILSSFRHDHHYKTLNGVTSCYLRIPQMGRFGLAEPSGVLVVSLASPACLLVVVVVW